jgi:hypothetical protein
VATPINQDEYPVVRIALVTNVREPNDVADFTIDRQAAESERLITRLRDDDAGTNPHSSVAIERLTDGTLFRIPRSRPAAVPAAIWTSLPARCNAEPDAWETRGRLMQKEPYDRISSGIQMALHPTDVCSTRLA